MANILALLFVCCPVPPPQVPFWTAAVAFICYCLKVFTRQVLRLCLAFPRVFVFLNFMSC